MRPASLCCRRALRVLTALPMLACEVGHAQSDEPADQPVWEGAVGAVLHRGPAYPGSAHSKLGMSPGFYLRYGRFSATNTIGFVTGSRGDVESGLAAEVLRLGDFRINLGMRFDAGRDAASDPAFSGLPNVHATVRLRLLASKNLAQGWQFAASISPDVLSRGGGTLANLGLRREWRLSPTLRLGAGAGLGWADGRYQRSYFGIGPAQGARTGLASYRPGAGLLDVGASIKLYADFGPNWLGYLGGGGSSLLGDARNSPLTRRSGSWNASSGLAWRF